MIKPNAFAKDADQVGYFEPSEESELFAKRLVSAISKGGDHISLTLTGKGAIAFARELSERLLAEKSQKAESNVDNQEELIQFYDSLALEQQQIPPADQYRPKGILSRRGYSEATQRKYQ